MLFIEFRQLNHDKLSPNGVFQMRKRILEAIAPNIKFVTVNLRTLYEIKDRNEKLNYLNSIVIDVF